MLFHYTLLSLLSIAGLSQAQTPQGVFPPVPSFLAVAYNGQFVNTGNTVDPGVVAKVPQIGLPKGVPNNGEKYLLVIIDLDYNQDNSGTFLQAMIQDFTLSAQNLGSGATLLSQNFNTPATYLPPIPLAGTGHRYQLYAFTQPKNWVLPAKLKQPVARRLNFDIREFITQTGLQPLYGNWFTVNNDGSYVPGNGESPNAGPSAQPPSPTVGPIVTQTTLPNGGPTSTYTTTGLTNGNGGNNGGSGSSGSGGIGNPNNGGSCAGVNFSNGNGQPGFAPCIPGVSTFYTTGFLGFTVLTSRSVAVYTTTAQLPNGQLTSFRTSSTSTVTRAFSGVSYISQSTYLTAETATVTNTGYINGQLTTYTTTTTSFGTTTGATQVFFGAAATPAPNVILGKGAAMLAVAGAAALAVL